MNCDCDDCRRARGAWTRFIVWAVVLVVLIVSGGAVACDEARPEPAAPAVVLVMFLTLIGGAWCLVQLLNLIARRAGHGP